MTCKGPFQPKTFYDSIIWSYYKTELPLTVYYWVATANGKWHYSIYSFYINTGLLWDFICWIRLHVYSTISQAPQLTFDFNSQLTTGSTEHWPQCSCKQDSAPHCFLHCYCHGDLTSNITASDSWARKEVQHLYFYIFFAVYMLLYIIWIDSKT